MSESLQKIIDMETIHSIFQSLKEQNKRIIFTNGCFDLLHVGHLRSLEHARRLGDLLVVGINDDVSVRALKGESRPIFPQNERAELIAGFACVDYVIIFSGTTVKDLLYQLQPHVHAKGTDYTEDNVPERDVVLSYGGEIAITGDPKDHSSSSILESKSKQNHEEEST